MIVIYSIFLVIMFILTVVCIKLWRSNVVKSTELKKILAFYDIEPGDKAIIADFALLRTESTGKKKNYTVTYEVEVIDISNNKVKVKVTDISSQYAEGNDPTQRSSIIQIVNNTWVSKCTLELITTDNISTIRDKKLQEILKK